jgi:hypothetical protein
VLSFIGNYTNLRGGQVYSSLIRKTEPKPLRVFVQDGKNDLNIYAGSWVVANQDMAAALSYAGYDTKFVVGTEGTQQHPRLRYSARRAALALARLPQTDRQAHRHRGPPVHHHDSRSGA